MKCYVCNKSFKKTNLNEVKDPGSGEVLLVCKECTEDAIKEKEITEKNIVRKGI
jgi:hypothetical protein